MRRLGKSYVHPLVVLIALPNASQQTRFGIVTSRALGGAVIRNRSKRQIRAAIQPLLNSTVSGWDIVIIARKRLVDATFKDLSTAIAKLLRKALLLQK